MNDFTIRSVYWQTKDKPIIHYKMYKLILLRHGESIWEQENRFTGWSDPDLSEKGKEEARHAGDLLKSFHFRFDTCYTSYLQRAIKTQYIIAEEMGLLWVPVIKN